MLEFTHRDHTAEGDELIGNVLDDGAVIQEERSNVPLSGAISLSQLGNHLGQGNRMWLGNGYMKDLIQRPAAKKSLSEFYGAAWGQPHTGIDQGAGMNIVKWDWRFDGNGNVDVTEKNLSGSWGSTKASCAVYNNSSCTGPAAYSGNGYGKMEEGRYTLTFNWSDYQRFVPSLGVSTESDCYVAVWGYTNGYLNGSRAELVKYQKVKNASGTSGSRSINFVLQNSTPHMVVNFAWWCDKWGGSHGQLAKEGIKCSISNAKVVRTA